jgi:hypothetical protein
MDTNLRNIILRAIASRSFVFRFDSLDSYWTTIAISKKRDALDRIAPSIFSLLYTRWAGEPVKLLKVSNPRRLSRLSSLPPAAGVPDPRQSTRVQRNIDEHRGLPWQDLQQRGRQLRGGQL